MLENPVYPTIPKGKNLLVRTISREGSQKDLRKPSETIRREIGRQKTVCQKTENINVPIL